MVCHKQPIDFVCLSEAFDQVAIKEHLYTCSTFWSEPLRSLHDNPV
jgi:hypothetical protein